MRRSSSAIILFTLTPEAEGIRKPLGLGGSQRSTRFFATLIEHVESVCAGLAGADLLVASESPLERLRWLPQRGGDFGESLRFALEDAFALGYERVIVIGNDAPEISRNYLRNALDELASGLRRAVVGPAADGGYNLLGLTAPCGAAFVDMPWGSSDVARLTIERLSENGFAIARLQTLEDIDSSQALTRFLIRGRAGLERLIASIRALTEPVGWIVELTLGHLAHEAVLGSHHLRAPPAFS